MFITESRLPYTSLERDTLVRKTSGCRVVRIGRPRAEQPAEKDPRRTRSAQTAEPRAPRGLRPAPVGPRHYLPPTFSYHGYMRLSGARNSVGRHLSCRPFRSSLLPDPRFDRPPDPAVPGRALHAAHLCLRLIGTVLASVGALIDTVDSSSARAHLRRQASQSQRQHLSIGPKKVGWSTKHPQGTYQHGIPPYTT